jgi:CheY-like chemotaxis protein
MAMEMVDKAAYTVTAVRDGLAAKEEIRRRPPDLTINNVRMPG